MNTKDLIGRTITDILVWSKMEVGGLDEAKVFIKLENDTIVSIPWDFNSSNIKTQLTIGAESVFNDLEDIAVYLLNPEGKTVGEIIEEKRKRESSLFGRIRTALGIQEGIPREYRPYKTEFRENMIKYLRNQRIKDFLMFENYDSVGFLELENGFIITEIIMAPHGTGKAGLNYYENLSVFEESFRREYKRLTDNAR